MSYLFPTLYQCYPHLLQWPGFARLMATVAEEDEDRHRTYQRKFWIDLMDVLQDIHHELKEMDKSLNEVSTSIADH